MSYRVPSEVIRKSGLKRRKRTTNEEAEEAPDLSPAQVQDWLKSIGFPEVGEAAAKQGLTSRALPFLGHEGWAELGIASAVARAKVMSLLGSLRDAAPPAREPTEPAPPRAWSRLTRVVNRVDRFLPADHKKVWFQHLVRSSKSPDEIKQSLAAQMDSYNLLTLLLLATVIPTATGICSNMKWDDDGWPSSRVQFAYLVFSMCFSGTLYAHFGMSHVTNVMVSDVSRANLHLFMESMGVQLLTELGMLFAVNFFGFLIWLIFSAAALIPESAHWGVWLLGTVGVLTLIVVTVFSSAIFMAKSSARLTHFAAMPVFMRVVVHSGLMSHTPIPLDASLPRTELLERLAARALLELDPGAAPEHENFQSEVEANEAEVLDMVKEETC